MEDLERLKRKARQLRGLPQFKGMSEEEIIEFLRSKGEEGKSEEREYRVTLPDGRFVRCKSSDEYKHIKSLLDSHLAHFDFSKHYDDLYKLLVLELRFFRVAKLGDDPKVVELQTNLSKEIRATKERLGITMDRFNVGGETVFQVVRRIQERAKAQIAKMKGQFTWKCPHCGQMVLQEVPHFAFDPLCRHEDHDPRGCPQTKNYGQVVWNWDIAQLVKEGRLKVTEAARILKISPIGFLATAKTLKFDLGFNYDLEDPDSLGRLLEE